ncbi:MAG: nucleotide exchange factor GrpE [Acidimicrobiales bacterium]
MSDATVSPEPPEPDVAPGPDAAPAGDGDVAEEGAFADFAAEDATAEADAAAARGSVEELIADLERTVAERDEYLDLARRTQAEFENYRKRVANQAADDLARASASLVEQLLPVLDACDGAIAHGAAEVEPIYAALLQTLEKQGLERIDPVDQPFDPNQHEAVMHEPGDGSEDGTVVTAVMRAGYGWKGLVVRPAMVKVRG